MAYRITTNNHHRPVVDAWELPIAARDDFDYLDWSAIDEGGDAVVMARVYVED